MEIAYEIIRMIGEAEFVITPVTRDSDLYNDLGYDSLAFVGLLLRIEETYSIQFELMEMGKCLQTGRLITIVERKLKEAGHDKAFTGKSYQTG